ncbi:DUF3300 domain-containing protein [Comamonas sp. w2-DMI]|uniref:DUF3300 domain-containing protein n=1 Tax=Comamonas sp. w2-DMI TaxID=3126391 RepID=UPI0032E49988
MSHFPRNRPPLHRQPHGKAIPHWRPGIVALAAAMALSACNDKDSPIKADNTASAPAPATAAEAVQPQPAAYVPPAPDVLYQMVAPIALYPDKLVAQILAGATYPDQIGAAEAWLGQNPGLQKTALANAVNAQNWDPSVKSLTQFPNVLEQMASNLPWTTALGKAYYNDPSDVMNAIQVMRNRAYKAGTLKTSKQLRVNVAPTPSAVAYTPGALATPLPEPVIEPPEQYIEIAPSQVDTVYVPQYNPGVVYGQPLPVYGGYRYVEVPPPAPVVGVPVMAGLLGFGAGIVLAESMDRHPSWGWNSWNMHWGDPDRRWHHGDRPPPQARPAVVYNNTTYVSQSRTVVQNIRRTDNIQVNNVYENGAGGHGARPAQPQAAAGSFAPQHGQPQGAMAAGAAGTVAGAAALAAGSHALMNQRQQAPGIPANPPQGRPGFAQGQGPSPGIPQAPGAHAFMPPHALHDRSAAAHPAGPQGPQTQTTMAQKAPLQAREQQQGQMQQHSQEQAQRQQQMQQQRAQEQAQRQQQMQQQRAQEQAQRQQQMQQQRAQEQAQRQQQMQQQRAQEQAQRQQHQAEQQARMQAARAEARSHGEHERR